MMAEREITVAVKSSLNLPSVRSMRSDIEKLNQQRKACRESIARFEQQIDGQMKDRAMFEKLAANPVDDDGVRYNPEACDASAKRCDKHIGMFKALIEKEQAKIAQLDYMIEEINKRICLSDQMSQ